jgi:hypothetical protein
MVEEATLDLMDLPEADRLAGSLARSGSLRFAPPVSGCHALNVQLNW